MIWHDDDHRTPREFDACDGSDLDRFGIRRDASAASPADRAVLAWLIVVAIAALVAIVWMLWRQS